MLNVPVWAILWIKKQCVIYVTGLRNLRHQVSKKTEVAVRIITETNQSSIESWYLKVVNKLMLHTAM